MLGLFAAGPAQAQSSDSTLRALAVEVSTDGVNFTRVGIDPEFSPAKLHFESAVQASAGHTHVRLTGTVNHGGATLRVGKIVGGRRSLTPVASGSPSGAIALADGANQILVAVTAQDRVSSRTYVVTVSRGGRVIPAPPRYVKVTAGTAKLTLTWTAPAYWGSFPAKGYEVDWYAGTTPPDEDSTNWNTATPTPSPLAATATSYEFTGTHHGHTVADGTTYQLRVRALNANPNDDTDQLPSEWVVVAGTPPSGSSQSSDARLSGLTAGSATSSTGTFSPLALTPSTFAAETTEYMASVANDRTHVKLTPTVNEQNAMVKVGKGTALTSVMSGSESGPIALDVGANVITVRVTAGDGNTTRDYTVTVTRQAVLSTNANLSALTASTSTSADGTYNTLDIGTFGASTTSYTASVANAQTHLKLTPAAAGSNASVKVGKQGTALATVTSGQASDAIALALGANAITVEVTAQDTTTTKTYTVTVTRLLAAPSGLQVTAGDGSLDLSWTAPPGTVTGYDVHYTSALKTGATPVADDAAVQTGGVSAGWTAVSRGTENDPPTASQALSGLTNNTEYRVRVRAKNTDGNGDWVHGTGTPQQTDTTGPSAPVVRPGRGRDGDRRGQEHHADVHRGGQEGQRQRRLHEPFGPVRDPDADTDQRFRHGHSVRREYQHGEDGHHHRPGQRPSRRDGVRGDLQRLLR